jgi:hypothetical protein
MLGQSEVQVPKSMQSLFVEIYMHIRASLTTEDGTVARLGKHLTYVVLLLPILQHRTWKRIGSGVTLRSISIDLVFSSGQKLCFGGFGRLVLVVLQLSGTVTLEYWLISPSLNPTCWPRYLAKNLTILGICSTTSLKEPYGM